MVLYNMNSSSTTYTFNINDIDYEVGKYKCVTYTDVVYPESKIKLNLLCYIYDGDIANNKYISGKQADLTDYSDTINILNYKNNNILNIIGILNKTSYNIMLNSYIPGKYNGVKLFQLHQNKVITALLNYKEDGDLSFHVTNILTGKISYIDLSTSYFYDINNKTYIPVKSITLNRQKYYTTDTPHVSDIIFDSSVAYNFIEIDSSDLK